ncbi:helix-turn-helix domain-containing protein [Paracoccus denitrificans]|uniref:helix-turn-helix domain-containing protein n=1 Tax=Paracoccus denitrificans TaxID=266 RepID=UPI0033651E95
MSAPEFSAAGFSRRLRDARIRSGMTVQEAAAVCMMPMPTLEAYLYRQHLPTASALFKIAVGLSVSTDWLLFGDGGRNG